jgi:hypothetical protein
LSRTNVARGVSAAFRENGGVALGVIVADEIEPPPEEPTMIRTIPLLFLTLLLGALPSVAQTTLAEFQGSSEAYLSAVVGGQDLNFDGVPDIVTGARFDNTVAADAGAVFARSGATGAPLWWRYGTAADDRFGTSLAMSPDLNGDGVWDVVVGATGAGSVDQGAVYLLSGLTGAPLATFFGTAAGDGMGSSVAANFDRNKDGVPDIAGGAPFHDGGKGEVAMWNGLNGSFIFAFTGGPGALVGLDMLGIDDVSNDGFRDLVYCSLTHVSFNHGSGLFNLLGLVTLGASLASAGDTNGDGIEDLLIGDPWNSTAHSAAGAVHLWQSGGVSTSVLLYGDAPNQGLGNVVAGLGDLENDGWQDWAFGATNGLGSPGHVRIVSGHFKQELYRLSGSPSMQFPTDLAAVGDVNGDGIPDLAVADPTAGVASDGVVEIFSGYGPGFVNYCTPGTSANGCQPTISGSGTPSAFQPLPFILSASGVEGDTPGLFFYASNGRQANSWGNGSSFQCVTPPVKRAGQLPKSGTKNQCDGQFSQDLNAHWNGNAGKNPGPGTVCQAQLWYRDPFSTSNQTTSMSDAIEFYVDF